MQGEISKIKKRKRKRNRLRTTLNFSQERASYFFFIGLLIIAIFGCVASGAPRQGFYGILFTSIGILIALFPPVFITPKWLNIGLVLFVISLASSLLPRSFAGSQSWRIKLESLGLETGNLISPHPVVTVESLIVVGLMIILSLCAIGHRISRESFLKIASLFVIFVACYSGISMIFHENRWSWRWNPSDDFGFFSNRNHMATLMVMGSLVGVGCSLLYLKKKNRKAFLVTFLASAIICWAILGYSISRAGLILFILFQIIWFLCGVRKNLNYKLVISFLVLFSLAIILFFLSDTQLKDRVEKLLTEKESSSKLINGDKKSEYSSVLGLRKYIHADTYNMIQNEPWTGTGLGTYEFIYPFYKKESVQYYDEISNLKVLHPESNWLDLISQSGILSTIFCLVCIFTLLFLMFFKNRKSRYWLVHLSCILSVFCILIHGLVDVPGQKLGIIISGIFLIGITIKPDHSKDKFLSRYTIVIYQILAVGIFSIGIMLMHFQWFSSKLIIFSDNQTVLNKIQKLYNLSINAARERDTANRKEYLTSAINVTQKAIERTPLDSDLHFIRGKLYSFLEDNEEKVKSSFYIESTLDPDWHKLPLRQSEVWLFIDIKETRRLWAEALERSNVLDESFRRSTWNEILLQARKNPIQIRDTYKLILDKNDPHYIMRWMDFAGRKNLNFQMPLIFQIKLLSRDIKEKIASHWKKITPEDYEEYSKSQTQLNL